MSFKLPGYEPISVVGKWQFPPKIGPGAGTGGTQYTWPLNNGIQAQNTPFYKYPINSYSDGRSGTQGVYYVVGYKKAIADGRSGTDWVPGPTVTEGPGVISEEVRKLVAPDESALPYRGGKPMLRMPDEGDYKIYRIPKRAPERRIYTRVFKTGGEKGLTQSATDGMVAVWKGDPFRDGFDVHRVKKKDDWTQYVGFAIMLAVGGAFIMAAQAVAAAQAAAAATAASGATSAAGATTAATGAATTAGTAGATGASAGTGALAKVGSAVSSAVKAVTGAGGAAGAAGGASGAASAVGTAATLAKTAYSAYTAIQQVQDAKEQAEKAEKEALALEKLNRDAEAAALMQYAEQQRAQATALSLRGLDMRTVALFGGGALLLALLLTRKK